MLEETLSKEGYRVFRAYSGTEALYVLPEARPDLVLLDLMLPGLAGEDVLMHITGIPCEGGFAAKTADVVATIVCIYALTAVYSGIFVFITMIFTNRAVTAVACILSALALIVFDSLNIQLRMFRKLRHRFVLGDMEIKNAVTNISHDLRTPLTAILGYMDLLEREDKTEAACRYIKIIRERAEMMAKLTEELFKYSVIIADTGPAPAEPVSVNGVLEECIAAFYALLFDRFYTVEAAREPAGLGLSIAKTLVGRMNGSITAEYEDNRLSVCIIFPGEDCS